MKVVNTDLYGVVIIEPNVIGDERGYFYESFSQREFEEKVCRTTFVQDNQSYSHFGVLRGLHFQRPPYAQSKLIRVTHGKVIDIAVDIRKGSPTYGKYVAIELSSDNNCQLFIPRGFAHGFVVLSDDAILQYRCDNYYNKGSEGAVMWNDPDLGVDWGISAEDAILSAKDKLNCLFKEFDSPFCYGVNYYE